MTFNNKLLCCSTLQFQKKIDAYRSNPAYSGKHKFVKNSRSKWICEILQAPLRKSDYLLPKNCCTDNSSDAWRVDGGDEDAYK